MMASRSENLAERLFSELDYNLPGITGAQTAELMRLGDAPHFFLNQKP